MPKVILIYANCQNTTAKGDFAFAGNIAKDLKEDIDRTGNDIDVILTSTLDGMERFEKLYGKTIDGRVIIEGRSIGISALELLDPVKIEVVAFIEANRCKYAPADIVKRIISPDSKFLFIGAANQDAISGPFRHYFRYLGLQREQPELYNHFDADDIKLGSSGLGTDRLGLPKIKTADELPELSYEQSLQIPNTDYGFIYLAKINKSIDLRTIAQYTMISDLSEYVLVGDYSEKPLQVRAAVIAEMKYHGTSLLQQLPKIHYHQSLDNCLMRHMVAKSTGNLVLSTGVMSAIEAMNDKKLPYYQTLPNNTNFVASYLLAVKDIASNDSSLIGAMPQIIIELSNLLFADKPLSLSQVNRTKDLLSISSVPSRLIETNQKIIKIANGTLAGQLLSFIGNPTHTKLHRQCVSVCQSLRKSGEINSPVYDQALRRAAAWGRIFELKVLIKSMSVEDISKQDISGKRCTALHWAVLQKQIDCVNLLILAGAKLNTQDINGKTPLHYAIQAGERSIIQSLVEHGASLEIPDISGVKPCDGAEPWVPEFIHACLSANKSHLYSPVDSI
ncbi:Dot/Icm T4SS effector AnkY/LegA9 [Legionella quateirensis]|uniref:Ankyrin-repeat containing protein. Substrate of the Dot/Icm secretion system n=1 Tax=Legionella quateirensis TaxID=45072 RepID=A0A378KRY0_9GAMM|nr:Dot/Icm T4SS effector AnkY/LegA9 [Legionella quateirensis]KTD43689.1 Rolling pebbles isoform 7 [Legionella quateirensis]STY17322.1 Ankyrin-repeat containing protein. Substrate of the Dot/Icm secretion system [Legionella quateirensis]